MSEMESVDRARGLLKRLFRTENADLDFGIYRIMNFKRGEIERFIDEDLIEVAEAEFKEFARAGAEELESELERRKREINDIVPGTIGEDWEVLRNHDLPKVGEFVGVLEEYRAASVSEEQVQDVFNHVYEFFSRYYEDGDFIPRTRYGGCDKYYVPYNGEEVLLHWATKDMYYVKTGEYFNKYSFRAGRFRVTFKLVEAQIEQGNVKGDKKFFILHDENPVHFDEASGEIEIRFNYRALTDEESEEHYRRTSSKIQEDFIDDALTKIGTSLGISSISGTLRPRGAEEKSLMKKHLEAYVERNTKDFFIHKDLKGFLSKELEFYLKNEVYDLNMLENGSDNQTKFIMTKAKAIRGISSKIIEFLAQIEEFQKKLFEKKKFVLRTDYCITLDLIPEKFYEEIGKNEKQVNEWKNLYKLDKITKDTLYDTNKKSEFNVNFLKKYNKMLIDTKHFTYKFKNDVMNNIENIDDYINGLIIESENYQALNLLMNKYIDKIGCVYIDPPYNTGKDYFIYKDNYMHSSWLSLINDRLILSKNLLKEDSVFYVSIDDNEFSKLRLLLDNIFGNENRLSDLIWDLGTGTTAGHFARSHEYILSYSKNKDRLTNFCYKGDTDLISDRAIKRPSVKNPLSEIEFPAGIEIDGVKNIEFIDMMGTDTEPLYIIKGYKNRKKAIFKDGKLMHNLTLSAAWTQKNQIISWLSGIETYDSKNQRVKRFYFEKNGRLSYEKIRGTINPKTVLSKIASTKQGTNSIKNILDNDFFDFPKPPDLIYYLVNLVSQNEIILDFFAGSGTTGHAVINMNRKGESNKYILIDIDYVENIILNRIKKIIYSSEWKNKIPLKEDGISQFIKYQYLEQYEDSLNNIEFITQDSTMQSRLDRLPDYFITYMLDYETKDSPTLISFEQFKTPFNYRIKTISGGEEKEEPVDLVETFNYLLGLHVNRLRTFKDDDRLYKMVYGTRGNEQVVVIWRDTPDLDLKRDKEFIESTVLLDFKPETVYINGDSYLESAKPIEPEFKRLMGA